MVVQQVPVVINTRRQTGNIFIKDIKKTESTMQLITQCLPKSLE